MTPSIRLIARPAVDWEAVADFLDEGESTWRRSDGTTEAEELVEFSGRICYVSFGERQSPKTNKEYIRNLVDQGHESVLEHASWTFVLCNVTRSFSHQLVRHRAGFSYSQLSQQYVDHADFEMLPPIDLARYPRAAQTWEKAESAIRSAYKELKDALKTDASRTEFPSQKERDRFINTVARQVLPNATRTAIVFSANARALRHFLAVRGATVGDPEMREVSAALLKLMQQEAPAIFEDFDIEVLPDGKPLVIRRTLRETP